jgi:hypothetical protein
MSPERLDELLNAKDGKAMRRVWGHLTRGEVQPHSVGIGADLFKPERAAIFALYQGDLPEGLPSRVSVGGVKVKVIFSSNNERPAPL